MPTVDRGDVRIHYELSGVENGEVLVLGNSLGSSLRMWDKVLPAFEAAHRVLRFDMRGHGASDVPEGPYTLDQLGQDVLLLLKHLHFDCVAFCGLSLGGLVGQWLGIHAAQRVRKLVLANTAARIGTLEMWNERIATVRRCGMDDLAGAVIGRWFTSQYIERHPQEMQMIRQMITSTDPTGYCACCGVLRDADLRSDIGSIETQCLVITGTVDPATPPSVSHALSTGLRDSRYVELEASHLSAWERADEFAEAVLAFLDTGRRCDG
jgi:3-oxoadipate enol-lactonase